MPDLKTKEISDKLKDDWLSMPKMLSLEEIKLIRKQSGLPPTEFSVKVGISLDTLRSWECDRRKPRKNLMQKLFEIAQQTS